MPKENLKKHVKFLTEVQPPRNYQNLNSLNKCADYIYSEFKKYLPDQTSYQEFLVKDTTYKNVITILPGESKERIVIGAHYDVHGDTPGADDNASAVAGLLETVRLITEKLGDKKPKFTLEFVAYSLEEQPHRGSNQSIAGRDGMGSYVHAKYIKDNNIPLKYMISYEMIGYFSKKPNSQQFPNHPFFNQFNDIGVFIAIAGFSRQKSFVNKFYNLYRSKCKIRTECIAESFTDQMAGRSDHRNYYENFGFNAIMLTDTANFRNPNYHRMTDSIDTLDFESMEEVVNAMVEVLIE